MPNDPCDDPNEYIDIDDEYLYGEGDPPAKNDLLILMLMIKLSANPSAIEDPTDEIEINDEVHCERVIANDDANPVIEKGALFPYIKAFRRALRQHAIKEQFEYTTCKTDPTRLIAKCKHEMCEWRIHASRLQDNKTIMVQCF